MKTTLLSAGFFVNSYDHLYRDSKCKSTSKSLVIALHLLISLKSLYLINLLNEKAPNQNKLVS